jgi:hypothetical protein
MNLIKLRQARYYSMLSSGHLIMQGLSYFIRTCLTSDFENTVILWFFEQPLLVASRGSTYESVFQVTYIDFDIQLSGRFPQRKTSKGIIVVFPSCGTTDMKEFSS